MQTSVREDRHLFLGGSEISCIMGISPFKTRFDLLLEKAQLVECPFVSNEYVDYGNEMEPKIREYLNELYNTTFIEERFYETPYRCHLDGFNGQQVLEIKTTSKVAKKVETYKLYLVQLLVYMKVAKVDKGLLAVYKRPKDFDTNFNKEYLQTFEIDINDYKDLLNEIEIAVDKFLIDLDKVKNNPLIEEWEL
jgi:putative phage-type endonuclease